MQTHPEHHRKQRKDTLRDAQQAWLDEIEKTLNASPTEIARLANISPATLTRMRYKAGYNGTLSANIVDRIEAGTGIAAPAEARPKRYERPVAIAAAPIEQQPAGLAEQDAEPYQAPKGDPMAGMVTAAVNGRVHVVPWSLTTRALEDEGYYPGDILIVDLNAQPSPGDIVCAQIYDFERAGRTKTVFRLFHPPFLVGAGREEGARVPQLIDSSVGIKGVVEYVIRNARR